MKTYTVYVYEKNESTTHPEGMILWCDEDEHLHCEHGPAKIFLGGKKEYWWHGTCASKAQWEQLVAQSKQHTIEIDGKKIVVSNESYESLKKALIG